MPFFNSEYFHSLIPFLWDVCIFFITIFSYGISFYFIQKTNKCLTHLTRQIYQKHFPSIFIRSDVL